MLWMENYFVYCSVRLGVLVISVLTFISCFIPSILFLTMGLTVLNPVVKLFNEDVNFRKYSIVKMLTNKVANDSTDLKVALQLYFFPHMLSCILAFYGSLKLKRYFLLPMIFFEFWRIIYSLSFHILIMTVAKNQINLGILITSTLAGGFLILYIGYNWATCIALYQIISLINSERYKSLYGEDPYNPLIPQTYNPSTIENVRVLITPTNYDIDEQKKRSALHKTRASHFQPVIAVMPVNNLESNSNLYGNNLKEKQNEWPTTNLSRPLAALPNEGFSTLKYLNSNDNYEVNYNNWQWSELAPAVTTRNKKNIYLDSNWNY